VHRRMRERVWEAAHVQLATITLDTDMTVHQLFGNQRGGRKGYTPKNRGKKSYQPILTFLAETREYLRGELRNGDRPTGARLSGIGRVYSRLCHRRRKPSKAGRMRVSTVGMQWRPTKTGARNSSSRPRRRPVWSRNRRRRTGNARAEPMPTVNASFAIRQRAGERHIDSSPCGTGRGPNRGRAANPPSGWEYIYIRLLESIRLSSEKNSRSSVRSAKYRGCGCDCSQPITWSDLSSVQASELFVSKRSNDVDFH
jgi:hypothetical protein